MDEEEKRWQIEGIVDEKKWQETHTKMRQGITRDWVMAFE